MRYIIPLWIFFLGLVYGVSLNRYFGWNWRPQSAEEVIADGIFVLIMSLAMLAAKE